MILSKLYGCDPTRPIPRRSSLPTWSETAASAFFPARTNHASSMSRWRTAYKPFESRSHDRFDGRPHTSYHFKEVFYGRVLAMSVTDLPPDTPPSSTSRAGWLRKDVLAGLINA